MGKRKLITDGKNGTDALDSPEKEALERMAQEPEKTEPGAADQVNSEKIKTKDSESTENFNVEKEFQKLYEQAIKMGLTKEDLARLKILHDISWNGSYAKVFVKYFIVFVTVVAVLYFNLLSCCLFDWPLSRETLVQTWMELYGVDIDNEPCVIEMPQFMSEIFRPPVECSFCENMTAVKTVYNISQEEFEELHAYTGVPVVIGDGTLNWTAPAYFSFEFFKEIYKEGSQALDNQEKNCQFFPYKSSFENLREVLSMSPERARMEDGSEPWYIGWSNCDFSAANILRKHYRRPYFLPKLSESSKTDWMFMGSPGYGANMHIDHVGNPSWQAQVTGTKLWTLEPPPECYYTCVDRIEVTVQPGQIIVLDTDIWYHSTLNVGLDISITIGSEYD